MRYDCWPIHGTYEVSVRSSGIEKRVWREHLWSCVGRHARTQFIIIACSAYGLRTRCRQRSWVMMWISEIQTSAVSVREFWCGGHCQLFNRTYFSTVISWHLRAIFKLATSSFGPQQLMLYWWWNKRWWMEDARTRLLYVNVDVRLQREHCFFPQKAAPANRTSLIKHQLSR